MQTQLTQLVPINLIEDLISIGMGRGADFAEVYLERSVGSSVGLEEKKIRTAAHGISLGVGIRVLAGTEVGYAYSDDLNPNALRETARVAASIARSGGSSTPIAVHEKQTPNRYPIAVPPDTIAPAEKVALLRRGDDVAHRYDSRITQVMGSFSDSTKEILIANSLGLLADDKRVMCRLNFSTIAMDSCGDRRTGYHGGGGRIGFDFFDEFSPEKVAKEAARMAISQLGAVDAPAGPQTIVLSPGWSGVLLHEAVGHGLEADFIHKATSLYAGRVGEKVASELVTVIDNGELEHRRGSLNIDDEGCIAQEKVLIEKGILKGFMVDHLSGQIMGIDSTGSGRRQSYKHAPMPRMTNTYMAGGPHTHDEIMASVDRGLYCASFGGGQVDISNGNFVFEVQEGYLIEKGQVTAPVKNATLIGVGPDAMKNVSMVGNNPELDPGIGSCGKDGQTVPVGVGMPTIRMDEITVGGTTMG
jgi:TldD protein